MGNTSSQPVASTQVLMSQRTPGLKTEDYGNDTSGGSEIAVSPGKRLATRQGMEPMKKRGRVSDTSIDVSVPLVPQRKRVRISDATEANDAVAPKKKRVKRARTESTDEEAILPIGHSEVVTSSRTEPKVVIPTTHAVEAPPAKASTVNPPEQQNHITSGIAQVRKEKQKTKRRVKQVLETQELEVDTAQHAGLDTNGGSVDADVDAVTQDQLAGQESQLDTPALIAKHKSKQARAVQVAEKVVKQSHQPQASQAAVTSALVKAVPADRDEPTVNPIGTPGPKRKAVGKNCDGQTVNPIGTRSPKRKAASKASDRVKKGTPEDEVSSNPIGKASRKLKAKRSENDAAPSGNAAGPVPPSVNPVGKPGPKRKAAVLQPDLTRAEGATGSAQESKPITEHERVLTNGDEHEVNAIGTPGPKRKKTASKGKRAAADSVQEETTLVPVTQEVDVNDSENAAKPATRNRSSTRQRKRRARRVLPGAKMPTPPESSGLRAVPERVDKLDQVENWLQSQESPVVEDSAPVPVSEPADADRQTTTSGEIDQSTEYTDVRATGETPLPAPLLDGPSSGSFSGAERDIADAVLRHCVNNDPKIRGLHHLLTQMGEWKTLGMFKAEIQDALPCRNRAALRRFCQRRYHVQERGPWTAQQDELLRRAYSEHPDKWVPISAYVNRTAQDCRDRYKNITQYGEALVSGPWSESEESSLVAAVEECIDTIKSSCNEDDELTLDRERLEQMIDWKTVASKMEGRSRKRCLEKWQQLKKRSATALKDQATKSKVAAPPKATDPMDLDTRKMRRVEAKMKLFETGDYYDVMVEIHTAIDDHTKVYHDSSTFWAVVSMANPGSRFQSTLRRRAYHEVLETWGWKDKSTIQRAETVPAKAKAMAVGIEKSVKKQGKALVRGFNPKKGVVNVETQQAELQPAASKPAKKAAKRSPPAIGQGKSKQLSNAYVINSDDEEEGNVEHPPQADEDVAVEGTDEDAERTPAEPEEDVDEEMSDVKEVEDVDNAPQGQPLPTAASDDVIISSESYEPSVHNAVLGDDDFMRRCQAVGRQQHTTYSRRLQRRRERRRLEGQ